jgi:YidC/Oxa1 family membrane protein insertase
MAQQFYVIRNNPAPGTEAEKAKIERDRIKAERHGQPATTEIVEAPVEEKRPAQRQQPKKQTRQQRRAGPTKPADAKRATKPTTKDEESQ